MGSAAPAISTRIEHRDRQKAKGQRRHDMREGPQPKYVNAARTTENSVLMEPTKESALAKICDKRAARQTRQRARKSNAAIATCGIVTFSKAAQPIVDALPPAEQDRLLLDTARRLADAMGTTLHGAVVHRDETALHMHYRLAAVRTDGRPISKVVDTKHLQDAAAAAWSHLGIERGTPKQVRQDLGEPASAWTHRSVKQLHEDLPAEIDAAEQTAGEQINAIKADAEAQIEAAKARATEAETQAAEAERKATQTANRLETAQTKLSNVQGECTTLEKRVTNYQRRLDQQQEDLTAKQAELEEAKREVERLDSELKALANSDEDQPEKRQVIVSKTEERGWGPWSRREVVGERRLTYIRPKDTEKWRGAVLKRAKDAREDAEQRREEAATAERQRKQEAKRRQQLQNALIHTMTAPAAFDDAEAALWAAEAVLIERYGVQMQVAAEIARVPPQDGLSDRQIGAALYREGRDQGWKQQWFRVPTGVAREIIEMARDDDRLDRIRFRDSDEATAMLEKAREESAESARMRAEAADPDFDPLGDSPPPRPLPRSGPSFGR